MFFFIQTKTPQTLIDYIIWLSIDVTEDALLWCNESCTKTTQSINSNLICSCFDKRSIIYIVFWSKIVL